MQRRRTHLALAIPLVVVVGLAARFALDGAVADAAGGAFYTALVYLLIAFARPTWPPLTVGLAAFGFSFAIECFQLTSIPGDLADRWSPVRLVLGRSFAAADIPAYAVGAVAAVAIDRRTQ